MGTQNKRFGAIRDLSLIESRRMQLQTAIDNGKSIEIRRRFGQFATPYELAKEIMSFGLTLQDKKKQAYRFPVLQDYIVILFYPHTNGSLRRIFGGNPAA